MGRGGGGAGHGGGAGGGGGKSSGKGKGTGSWNSGARQAPGNWGSQGRGAWAGQPYYQGGDGASWGQPSDGWQQHAQGPWAQPPDHGAGHRSGGKGGMRYAPYGAPAQAEPDKNPGLWQGLRDVTAAANVALDAARELRSLGLGPTPTAALGRPAEVAAAGPAGGWLAAARSWLLGDAPRAPATAPPTPPPAPQAQPGRQAGSPQQTDCAALLARLLGSDAPARQEQQPPHPDLERLSADMLRQQQLLALLVERVASPPARPPAPAQPPAAPPVPAAPAPPTAPLATWAGQAAQAQPAQSATVDALLDELLLQRAAARAASGPAQRPAAPGLPLQEATAEEGGDADQDSLPLARDPPPLAAFNPQGEVSQEGAAAFWAWLDVTPRTPWAHAGPYGEWAGKVVFKVTSAELHSWADKAAVPRGPGHLSKRDLLDALAHACASQAQAGVSSGPSGTGTRAAKAASVLDRLRAAPLPAAS
jgi:hypothetical protein